MMCKRMAWLAIMLCATVVGSASAQPPSLYVGVGAGVNFTDDMDITGDGVDTSAELDIGWAGLTALGYRYGNGVRSEFEVSYRDNDVDSISGTADANGDIDSWSFMANVVYDFDTRIAIKPYLGVGVGGVRASLDGVSPVGGSSLDDEDTAFGAQGIAGLNYRVNDNLDWFVDYRYLWSDDLDLRTDSGARVDAEYTNHTIMVGFRLAFGAAEKKAAPPPAPAVSAPEPEPVPVAVPPTPAPVVPRTYLVFFGWNSADITPEAQDILGMAAENALAGGPTRIVATGHADRSGPDAYNLGLSQRRAESVQAELLHRGLSEKDIAIDWKGERDPLVETPDGVREPQNRRVEIVFQ